MNVPESETHNFCEMPKNQAFIQNVHYFVDIDTIIHRRKSWV